MKLFQSKVFKFLSSVQLALPMLLILAALLAVGTIVESLYSTALAKRFVYGTWWFAAFLFLLGINVLCSALSRIPWKKHHIGFVITHLGILFILAGSLTTQKFGAEGQIALVEGKEGHLFLEDKPTLYYQIGDDAPGRIPASFSIRVPSPGHPKIIRLPGEGLLMLDQFLLNAGKKVAARNPDKGEKGFPAIHLSLAGSFIQEDQWLFLGNPDYGHLDLALASVYFEREAAWKKKLKTFGKDAVPNGLAVLLVPDGSLKYQIRKSGKWETEQTLKPEEDIYTGWMDMRFKVSERMEDALPKETYINEPLASQKDPEPALHYDVVHYPDKKEGWIGYESQSSFIFRGEKFALAYGPLQSSLPFSVRLKKFNLGFDPGTEKPASFASEILYTDPELGVQMPAVISMNRPLRYKGFTLFQASYSPQGDGKYVSVFSVGKDPGIWLKYGGALILVLGIVFMFWFKNPAWKKKVQNA